MKCNIMQITKKQKMKASYTLEGTVLVNVERIKSVLFAQRLIGPLASLDITWRHVHKTLKNQHIRDWCVQFCSIV